MIGLKHTSCTCTLDGCFPGGMAHYFAYLANHLVFLPHFSCNFYLLQGLQNTKHHSVWCAGWSDTAYGCSKSRVHAAAAEAGGPSWYVSSSAALESELSLKLHISAELETYQLGPPALGVCKNRTISGLSVPPLE
jgi:hypothetical protein